MAIFQFIRSRLWPINGLSLEPSTPIEQAELEGNFEPRLCWLVGTSATGSTIIEATTDGALKTASTGSGLEAVEVSSGIATDTLTDLALSDSFTLAIFTVKNAPLSITFENASATYSSAIELAVGVHQREMSARDLQVANAQAGNPSTYQIEAYR